MATLNGFLNPKKIDTLKFALSDRFTDENGTPLEWEIRAISGDEIKEIQNKAVFTRQVGNKVETVHDQDKFMDMMLARSVITPDPNAADLQDTYGVKKPENVFGKMLSGAEYLTLFTKVSEINGLNKNIEGMVEEVKNS